MYASICKPAMIRRQPADMIKPLLRESIDGHDPMLESHGVVRVF